MNHEIARAIRRKFGVKVANHPVPIPSKHTRLELCDLWGELGYVKGVEIGVYRAGFSTELLTRIPNLHLTCIDPWREYQDSTMTAERQERNYSDAMIRLRTFMRDGRASVLRMPSLEALANFPDESLDFVFIDGDHAFDMVMLDLIYWPAKVRTGGMVAVHDYMPMVRGGVRAAVDAYTYSHKIEPWYVICEELPTAYWVKE